MTLQAFTMSTSLRFAATVLIFASVSRAVNGQVYKGEGCTNARKGRGPSGAFNTTVWLNRPVTDCEALTVDIVRSPNKEYALEQMLNCPDETISCWVGVRSRSSNGSEGPGGIIWSIPYVNLTLTQSCTLGFSKAGDLQLVISQLDIENGMPNHRSGKVVWNTNTAGKGPVQVQLQDNGNLVLVHEDGESVVWQSSTALLLPLAPLDAASGSRKVNSGTIILPFLSTVVSTALVIRLELHRLLQ